MPPTEDTLRVAALAGLLAGLLSAWDNIMH